LKEKKRRRRRRDSYQTIPPSWRPWTAAVGRHGRAARVSVRREEGGSDGGDVDVDLLLERGRERKGRRRWTRPGLGEVGGGGGGWVGSREERGGGGG
jgi:hypothetical protein